jgi:outer membrane protein assembly factor BamA
MKFQYSLLAIVFTLGSFAVAAHAETDTLLIQNIECVGNTQTKCDVIIDQTLLRVGDVLDDGKVKESKLRLELSGKYEEVSLRLSKGSEIGKVILTISVKDRSSLLTSGSFGYIVGDRTHYAIADVTVGTLNLSGHSDSLSVRVRDQHNQYPEYYTIYDSLNSSHDTENLFNGSIEYIRPSFFFKNFYLVAGVGYGNYADHYVASYSYTVPFTGQVYNRSEDSNYRENYFYGYSDLGYKFSDYWSISGGFRRLFAKYDNYDRYYQESTVVSQISWDSQDNANFPTQGARFQFDFEHALNESADSIDFGSHAWFSYLKHWQLSERQILSFRYGRFVGNDSYIQAVEDIGVSIRYTNYFRYHDSESGIQNADFYIEPGIVQTALQSQYGCRIGTTFQTSLGVVNLFLIGAF